MKFKKLLLQATLLVAGTALQAQHRISGTVTSGEESLPGAVISVQGTLLNTQTSVDGRYTLAPLPPGTYVLQTSYVGYETKVDTVILQNDRQLNISLNASTQLMEEVVIQSTRVDERSAMTYSNVAKEELEKLNLGQDLPVLLNQQASVVTTSDAGAGVGYTGLRIRGSDATRVNVTINGIPVNDAESQATFWVNMPDLASSVESIQLQRGVGSSTNGAGAFGGSLNIQTSSLRVSPYAMINSSGGSFNTLKNSFSAGTGLLREKFAFDARLSRITSDGFIDRASSDLNSWYLAGGYYGEKTIVKLITFSAREKTYQAWNGIPQARLNGDTDGMNTFIANNWLDSAEAHNLLNSGSRTYNQFTYQDQTDNYKQDNYQLHLSQKIGSKFHLNLAGHYTRGKGYYEEYRKGQALADYGLSDVIIGADTIANTDLIRRRWLDNHFYGGTFSLTYTSNERLSANLGGALNHYTGVHYGEIIWARFASGSEIYDKYYNDTADKTDFNTYLRVNYLLTKGLNLYADLQYRSITYSFRGFDDSLRQAQGEISHNFLNPKIGLSYDLDGGLNFYLSYSRGSKEPGRDDYTKARPENYARPEFLDDYEAGVRLNRQRFTFAVNGFYMNYKDQLILTGGLNDVGEYTRVNVAESFRRGIEAEAAWRIFKQLTWSLNVALSENKIARFEERIDNFDTGVQMVVVHENTDIAFSPPVVAGSTISITPFRGFSIDLLSKYVSSQFLDNTSDESRSIDAFFVNNIRVGYVVKTRFIPELGFNILVNNFLNEEYESNGYTYGYVSYGQHIQENFYYPQAGVNILAGLSLKF
jgi:iron complex outermembrane receptor protein